MKPNKYAALIKKDIATNLDSQTISAAVKVINESDAIVVGIGAGMTASGGVSYSDPQLVKRWFPEYAVLGYQGLIQIQSVFWRQNNKNILAYWGYWARHIDFIRYQLTVLEPYQILKGIIDWRKYFIITTNADGQVQKAGFDPQKIFAPQGNYDVFQCSVPCSWDTLYPNEAMVKQMVASLNERQEIAPELIPRCPKCGSYLVPNLRCDDKFVEKPHLKNLKAYEDFINSSRKSKLLFLELGVGYNTPGIIRFPFEQMTGHFPNARLLRINLGMATVSEKLADKALGIDADLTQVLNAIRKGMEYE